MSEALDEVRWLVEERDVRHLIFCDEILTVNRDRALALLDGLMELGSSSATYST